MNIFNFLLGIIILLSTGIFIALLQLGYIFSLMKKFPEKIRYSCSSSSTIESSLGSHLCVYYQLQIDGIRPENTTLWKRMRHYIHMQWKLIPSPYNLIYTEEMVSLNFKNERDSFQINRSNDFILHIPPATDKKILNKKDNRFHIGKFAIRSPDYLSKHQFQSLHYTEKCLYPGKEYYVLARKKKKRLKALFPLFTKPVICLDIYALKIVFSRWVGLIIILIICLIVLYFIET